MASATSAGNFATEPTFPRSAKLAQSRKFARPEIMEPEITELLRDAVDLSATKDTMDPKSEVALYYRFPFPENDTLSKMGMSWGPGSAIMRTYAKRHPILLDTRDDDPCVLHLGAPDSISIFAWFSQTRSGTRLRCLMAIFDPENVREYVIERTPWREN